MPRQPYSFVDSLAQKKRQIEAEAAKLPEGPQRQALFLKIIKAENAAQMDGSLRVDVPN